MKWFETIKVQAASGQETALENELVEMAITARKSSVCQSLVKIILSRHLTSPGFFGIHLWWETDEPPNQGSTPGLSLTQTLKEYGLVEHAVWIETICE